MFKKRLVWITSFIMVLCFALSFNGLAASNQNKHSNGNGKHHGKAFEYMIGQNFMRGDGNGNYNLSNYIVRGDMMILLVRAFNLHSNAGGRNFDDVLAGD